MRRNHPIRRLLWWVFLLIFLASGAWLSYYVYSAQTGAAALRDIRQGMDALRADATVPSVAGTPQPAASQAPAQTSTPELATAPAATPDSLLAYYGTLAAQNPDLAGWITIPDTVIDYPVMYTPGQPQKYLHRDFEDNYSFQGLPFLDARCDLSATGGNWIVYAHNMRSGQMFAQLIEYLQPDYLRDHPKLCWTRFPSAAAIA